MYLKQVLSGALAFACLATPLATSVQKPADGEVFSAKDAKLPTSMEVDMKTEQHWSLAQTSWSRSKVSLSTSRQGSFSLLNRIILAVLLFVSAFFAYSSNFPHMGGAPLISVQEPRRLANAFLQSLSLPEEGPSKTIMEAASHTVARLRLRGLRHRLVRLDEGEEGLLDDDRDSAKIQGYTSRAKAFAQRQQFEKAEKLYKKAIHMAKGVLNDFKEDKTGPAEVDEAQHQLTDAVMQTASFYLERGETAQAKKVLDGASTVIEQRTDPVAMRCRLLTANAHRDAGKFVDAVANYEALLKKIDAEAKDASPLAKAILLEIGAETRGQYARALLSEGDYDNARKLLDETVETLEKLTPTLVTVQQGPPTLLTARLKGWLAFAHLKEGNPKTALDLLDASLAGIGELPSGLAGATSEFQEFMQSHALAKAAMGSLKSAVEDLEVVQELQDELKKTISDDHNPEYAEGNGKVPDPHLWAGMARTRMIAAQFKLQNKSSNATAEAMSLAKQARRFLRELKKSDGRLPKGYDLATFAEVKDLIAKLRPETSEPPSEQSGQEDSENEAPPVPADKNSDDTKKLFSDVLQLAQSQEHEKAVKASHEKVM